MSTEQYQVTVQTECHHRRGLLYYAIPWLWGRPCRHCRHYPTTQIITVNQPINGATPPTTGLSPQMVPMQQQQAATVTVASNATATAAATYMPTDPPPQYQSSMDPNYGLPVKSS